MKKIILFAFIMLVTLSVVYAEEIHQFTTDIGIVIDGNTTRIVTENKEYEYPCGSNVNVGKSIILYRDVACNSDNLLEDNKHLVKTLSESLNTSFAYYDKYLECYVENKLMEQKYEDNESINYKEEYENAKNELDICVAGRGSLVTSKQRAESDLSTCRSDIKNMENSKFHWGIGGFVLGVLACYLVMKKKGGPAKSAAQQQLPTQR